MLSRISRVFDSVSNIWIALIAFIVYNSFIPLVMQPQSEDSMVYAGEWGAPDRHVFYTPDELYESITTWGAEGRQDYIDFRLGLDILWALAYTAWLVSWLSVAGRWAWDDNDPRRLLNTFPLITLCADYTENALGIWLIANFDQRMDLVAWLAATTTSVKWITLVLAHVLLVYALGAAAVRRIRARKTR
jgi:hypothetical protein